MAFQSITQTHPAPPLPRVAPIANADNLSPLRRHPAKGMGKDGERIRRMVSQDPHGAGRTHAEQPVLNTNAASPPSGHGHTRMEVLEHSTIIAWRSTHSAYPGQQECRVRSGMAYMEVEYIWRSSSGSARHQLRHIAWQGTDLTLNRFFLPLHPVSFRRLIRSSIIVFFHPLLHLTIIFVVVYVV